MLFCLSASILSLKENCPVNPTPSGFRNLSVTNSGDFWQLPDPGHRNLLHLVEFPTPQALVCRLEYSHIPQTKWYVVMPIHMTCQDRVKEDVKP